MPSPRPPPRPKTSPLLPCSQPCLSRQKRRTPESAASRPRAGPVGKVLRAAHPVLGARGLLTLKALKIPRGDSIWCAPQFPGPGLPILLVRLDLPWPAVAPEEGRGGPGQPVPASVQLSTSACGCRGQRRAGAPVLPPQSRQPEGMAVVVSGHHKPRIRLQGTQGQGRPASGPHVTGSSTHDMVPCVFLVRDAVFREELTLTPMLTCPPHSRKTRHF